MRAVEHPKNHYGWMLQGEELFRALESSHPLCFEPQTWDSRYCFETFPHAITWHLTNGQCKAARKRLQRRSLLDQAGIDPCQLTNIDLIDAALCALAAQRMAEGGECPVLRGTGHRVHNCPEEFDDDEQSAKYGRGASRSVIQE